jgi:vacuolar-type H+-ATPase subunit F/Vma7
MARVAIIGASTRVEGYGLGGAAVLVAETEEEVRAAWNGLAADVAVVILTQEAARVLGPRDDGSEAPLSVVLPS